MKPEPHKGYSAVMTLNQQIALVCAFRYALGRMTYVVDSVASELELWRHGLAKKDLALIIREIDEAMANKHAGMQMDIERWQECREIMQKALDWRNKHGLPHVA